MSTENRSRSTNNMTPDELKQYMETGGYLALGSIAFMIATAVLVHLGIVRLYPSEKSLDMMKTYNGRLEFTFRYQTLLVTWLIFNIFATIVARYNNSAMNPLSGQTEQNMTTYKNILTNSYEQIVLSVLAQLIFISFASDTAVLKVIPAVNIIQFIGRITFFYGYPLYRAFGFFSTIIPTTVLIGFDIYSFVLFLVK